MKNFQHIKIYLLISIFFETISLFSQSTFQVMFGGTQDEPSTKISQIPDGYIGISKTFSYGSGNSDLLYYKLDEQGNLIWAKVNGSSKREIVKDIIVNDDSYIFLNWYTYSSSS